MGFERTCIERVGQGGLNRAARATCHDREGGLVAEGRRAPACMSGVGWGAAWREKALLSEARMLKRLTYQSYGEKRGWCEDGAGGEGAGEEIA